MCLYILADLKDNIQMKITNQLKKFILIILSNALRNMKKFQKDLIYST